MWALLYIAEITSSRLGWASVSGTRGTLDALFVEHPGRAVPQVRGQHETSHRDARRRFYRSLQQNRVLLAVRAEAAALSVDASQPRSWNGACDSVLPALRTRGICRRFKSVAATSGVGHSRHGRRGLNPSWYKSSCWCRGAALAARDLEVAESLRSPKGPARRTLLPSLHS